MGQRWYFWGMSISSNQLRTARRVANLTQTELAEILGVSKRTVVNWEREGGGVPPRSESQVRGALDFSYMEGREVDPSVKDLLDPAPVGVDPDLRNDIAEQIFEGSKRAQRLRAADREGASRFLADTIIGARDTIQFAEAASRAGAHPATVLKLIEGAMAAVIETGAGSIPGEPAQIFIEDVVTRGGAVAREAVANFEPGSSRAFDYVDMGSRAELRKKEAAADSDTQDDVGRAWQDREPETPAEYGKYGLAAHPETDETGEEEYD